MLGNVINKSLRGVLKSSTLCHAHVPHCLKNNIIKKSPFTTRIMSIMGSPSTSRYNSYVRLCSSSTSSPKPQEGTTEEKKSEIEGRQILHTGPAAKSNDPSFKERLDKIEQAYRTKGKLLSRLIILFLITDAILLVALLLVDTEDSKSDFYLPPDTLNLILANLGLSVRSSIAPQYLGQWEEVGSENHRTLEFISNQLAIAELDAKSDRVIKQASGTVHFTDPDHFISKMVITETHVIQKPPTLGKDGKWTFKMDGRLYERSSM